MKNFYRVTMTIATTKNTAAVTAVASYTRGERQRGTGCDDQLRLGGGLELDYQAVVEALRRWLEVTAWEVGDDRAAEVLQGWAQLQLAGMGPQDGEPF